MDDKQPAKVNILSSFSWAYAERMLAQLVSFVVSVILARLLSPADYGIIAMVNVFIAISSALALTGFGSALIQKKDATDTDFSSTLFFSFGVICVVYGILFASAPLLSRWTKYEGLTPYIRVMSLSLVLSAVTTVQNAYVIRQMKFRLLFLSSSTGSAVSACVGIFMAMRGFGAWALVGQYLTASAVNLVMISLLSDHWLKWTFSLDSIRAVYGFGWKVAASSVADAVYRQLRSFLIGVKYSSADLAYYDKGNQFPSLLITNIDTSIANVLMPMLSKLQDDPQRVKETVRRAIRTSSVVLFPALIGLAACGESLISVMLTEKWLPCVPYLQALCIALMIKPLQTANFQGFLAMGHSDVYLRVQVLQKGSGVLVILVTALLFDSVLVIAVGEVIAYLIFELINLRPNRLYLNYTPWEHVQDFLPQLVLSLIMGAAVLAVGMARPAGIVTLALQICVGAVVYVALAGLTHMEAFFFLLNFVKGKLRKRK